MPTNDPVAPRSVAGVQAPVARAPLRGRTRARRRRGLPRRRRSSRGLADARGRRRARRRHASRRRSAAVRSAGSSVAAVQRALGIPADGIFGPQTAARSSASSAPTASTVDGIAGPATLAALGLSRAQRVERLALVRARLGAAPPARSRSIAQCESGGNPAAVSPSGQYRGKYQFTRATWRASAAPATRPPRREADAGRASRPRCYARPRHSPWPVCGRTGQRQRSVAGASRIRSTRAGAPAATALAGTSFVTTVFVPMIALSPTVAPRRMHAP